MQVPPRIDPSEPIAWRRRVRPATLRDARSATTSLAWSPRLIEFVLDELCVADALEEMLGEPLRDVPEARYPQIVALALVLKHSWRPDDLRYALDRLGLTIPITHRE